MIMLIFQFLVFILLFSFSYCKSRTFVWTFRSFCITHSCCKLQLLICYELPTYLQIAVALLNARISLISFNHWLMPLGSPIIALMLSKLSLVVPLVSTHGNADFIFMFIHYCCHHSFLIVAEYYSGCSFSVATYTTRDHTFCWRFKIWYTQVLSSLS